MFEISFIEIISSNGCMCGVYDEFMWGASVTER